jgi:hypothetical protein
VSGAGLSEGDDTGLRSGTGPQEKGGHWMGCRGRGRTTGQGRTLDGVSGVGPQEKGRHWAGVGAGRGRTLEGGVRGRATVEVRTLDGGQGRAVVKSRRYTGSGVRVGPQEKGGH